MCGNKMPTSETRDATSDKTNNNNNNNNILLTQIRRGTIATIREE